MSENALDFMTKKQFATLQNCPESYDITLTIENLEEGLNQHDWTVQLVEIDPEFVIFDHVNIKGDVRRGIWWWWNGVKAFQMSLRTE